MSDEEDKDNISSFSTDMFDSDDEPEKDEVSEYNPESTSFTSEPDDTDSQDIIDTGEDGPEENIFSDMGENLKRKQDEENAKKKISENAENNPPVPEGKNDGETDSDTDDFTLDSGNESQGLENSPENNQTSGQNPVVEEVDVDSGNGEEKKSLEYVEKKSFDDVEKQHEAGPKVLNKKFIFGLIVVAFMLIMVVSFLSPSKKTKKDSEKKLAQENNMIDPSLYQAKGKKNNDVVLMPDTKKNKEEEEKIEEEFPPIPPVYDEKKAAYNGGGRGSSSSGGYQRPDTRNDTLHGKQISGIKGLSSTQQKYSTDYNSQVEQNVMNSRNANALPSREEYVSQRLNQTLQAAGYNSNPYELQNDQSGKRNFFMAGRDSAGTGSFLPKNSIWEGTIFEAVLTTAINTDNPGDVTARISKNIYSSQDGKYLLIPQNSILIGTYNSSVSYAQKRVQIVWTKLIRPDGYELDLGALNTSDSRGASGLKGFVNDHPWSYLKAIILMSTVSIANGELSGVASKTDNKYIEDVVADTQNIVNKLGDKLIDRAMNVQPTIYIKEGTEMKIIVNQNFVIPAVERIPVTKKYRRYY